MDQSGLSINSWFVMIITGEKNDFLEARRISEFRRSGKMTLLLFFFQPQLLVHWWEIEQADARLGVFFYACQVFLPKCPLQVETKSFGHVNTSSVERGVTSCSSLYSGECA